MRKEDEMKNTWVRFGIVAGVLAACLTGASALATPDLVKKDTSKCGELKHRVCGTSCEDSV